MHAKSGQAMVEFAVGLFVFALILSALFAFGAIIPRTTQLQSDVRRDAGRAAESGRGGRAGSLPVRISENLPSDVQAIPALELVTEERVETVDLDALAAEYLFETNEGNEYRIRESAAMPVMGVPTFDITALGLEGGLL